MFRSKNYIVKKQSKASRERAGSSPILQSLSLVLQEEDHRRHVIESREDADRWWLLSEFEMYGQDEGLFIASNHLDDALNATEQRLYRTAEDGDQLLAELHDVYNEWEKILNNTTQTEVQPISREGLDATGSLLRNCASVAKEILSCYSPHDHDHDGVSATLVNKQPPTLPWRDVSLMLEAVVPVMQHKKALLQQSYSIIHDDLRMSHEELRCSYEALRAAIQEKAELQCLNSPKS